MHLHTYMHAMKCLCASTYHIILYIIIYIYIVVQGVGGGS